MLTLLSSAAFGFNEQTAEELFRARGENTQNAYKAFELYTGLANTASTTDEKAQNYFLASQAVYYVGAKSTDNASRKKYHELGYTTAAKGVALLENKPGLSEAQKELLANNLYFYGANLGKWGEANGIASSLGRWPELQETMKKIIKLNMAYVQDYGAYRILGRAFYKLPFPLGSNQKSLNYLKTAFEETKHGQDISHSSINVIYYANVLIAVDQNALAKTILTSLINKDPASYNKDRIPETIDDQAEAKTILSSMR